MANNNIAVVISAVSDKFDAGLKGAKASLANFRTSVADADGVTGKFKAGAGAAFDAVKANASQLALVGGAALVGFALKGAAAFTDTAKAAIDLSTATGLSVEQASRWIAVGDDFEVSAEALQTGLGKIAKTMDDTKWAEYGIATRDAGGEARSVNDILLDSFDKLSSVTNATERARIGQELFGKGYQSLTPILGQTRAEYEKMLSTQSAGQVITTAEAEKAEKLRLAQDALGDALKDLSMALGQVVAAGAPVINVLAEMGEGFAKVISIATGSDAKSMSGPVEEFHDAIKNLGNSDEDVAKLLNAFTELKTATGDARSSMDKTGRVIDTFFGELADNGEMSRQQIDNVKGAFAALGAESPGDLEAVVAVMQRFVDSAAGGNEGAQEWIDKWGITQGVLDGLRESVAKTTPKVEDLGDAADETADDMAKLSDNYSDLLGAFGVADVWDAVKNNFDEIGVKGEAAWAAAAAGAPEAEAKAREYEAQLRDTKAEVIKYATEIGNVPEETLTNILALIDAGDIAAAEAAFDQLKQPITKNVYINTISDGTPITAGSKYAAGTDYSAGGTAWVGENGPELVNLPEGSQVSTNFNSNRMRSQGGPGFIQNVTINLPVGADPRKAAEIARRYQKRTGRSF